MFYQKDLQESANLYQSCILLLISQVMKGQRYVYFELSNQNRLKKVSARRQLSPPAHECYLKSRQTMSWRVQKFAKKQDYQYITNPLTYVQERIRDQYNEYEDKLRKYWGGGKYFKKMGRMDKVRYKENMRLKKEQRDQKQDQGYNKQFQVFHQIDVKATKWIVQNAFYTILAMKKPIRNIQYCEEN